MLSLLHALIESLFRVATKRQCPQCGHVQRAPFARHPERGREGMRCERCGAWVPAGYARLQRRRGSAGKRGKRGKNG
jgi:DNA-directed RNA polymerase subunit RPC12/RpoP